MKREPPSDREIAELIAPAFERLAAPDARRLAAIEQRLPLTETHPRGRSKIAWWWLAAALAAGAASALWWGVNYDSSKKQGESALPEVTLPSTTPAQPLRPDESETTETAPAGTPADKHNPLIFRRER